MGRNKGFVCPRWHDNYTVSFTLAEKKKYIGVNLTKYVQDLNEKNYKFWWKKSKK